MKYHSYEIETRLERFTLANREDAEKKAIELRSAGFGVTCIARDAGGAGRALYLTPKSCRLKPAMPRQA